MPHKPQTHDNTYFVFTVTREDLATLSRRIIRSVPPHMLLTKDKPLTINLNGTKNSGKTLIIDAITDTIFDSKHWASLGRRPRPILKKLFGLLGDPQMSYERYGDRDYSCEERCEGEFQGQIITTNFVDCAVHSSYMHTPETYKGEKGIAFTSNMRTARDDIDISFWVEEYDIISNTVHASDQRRLTPDFMDRMNDTDRRIVEREKRKIGKDWIRYVEIKIQNEDLLNTTALAKTLRALKMMPLTPDTKEKAPVFHVR